MNEPESLKHLWTLCIWFFGISTTVTIGIFGWLMKIQGKISIGESLLRDIKKIVLDLDEIKIALTGDYDKKGFISRLLDIEKRIEMLENRQNGQKEKF